MDPPPFVKGKPNHEALKKSFFSQSDPTIRYCTEHSVKFHPSQQKLMEATLNSNERFMMLGAPEVLQYCANLIQLIKGKRCLDVGTFTGASALAWALATPPDGQVITMDVSDSAYRSVGLPIIQETDVAQKINLKLQPALQTLDELLANNEAGKFDFAFIDAMKNEYPEYYQKCMQLIRPGGVIAIDNSLWMNKVTEDPKTFDSGTKAIDDCNKLVFADSRVNCSLLPIGDGLMVAFNKFNDS